ncbi:DsrE family protein [Halobacteriaceae archaeon GCM10025711]
MGSKPHSRRRFLQFVGAGTLAGLAGCTGNPLQGSSDTTEEPPGETTTTDEPTETETETTTEEPTMSTVFHLTSGTESEQKHALGNVANLLADQTVDTDQVVLVANSRGITAFTSDSTMKDQVTGLLDKDVAIRVCENSMDAFSLSESDFIEGVGTVPSGVGELTELQAKKEFAYIRVP